MSSTFAWLDYSDNEKRKMLDVISQFRERDTRDELGIGTVRDAFSDMFFPGTSTIQTRARYFLFIPWIYSDIEQRKISPKKIAAVIKQEEIKLINALLAGGESEGVIGKRKESDLKRFPSNIYWQGLRTWGIFLNADSQDAYHRYLYSYYASHKRMRRKEDIEVIDDDSPRNWHALIPQKPAELLAKTTFKLTQDEAKYLRDSIRLKARDSLLAYLVPDGRKLKQVDFPWETPHFTGGKLPSHLMEQLRHARNFSEAIHGAALLYNLMLAEKRGKRKGERNRVEEYRVKMADWADNIKMRESEFKEWDWRMLFWRIVVAGNSRIPIPTQNFIKTWFQWALEPKIAAGMSDNNQARMLIFKRERDLKGDEQARLYNHRALEQWTGAAGTARLSYRWQHPVRDIISDIAQGLKD